MRTALAVAAAIGALPQGALFIPGHSLAGVRLGEPAAQVRASFGAHGTCESCSPKTWYFTYTKFTQPGLAVELRAGRVAAAYTVWQPQGWHTGNGLRLGAVEGQVTKLGGQLTPIECPGYIALVHDGGAVRTAYYVLGGKLWGFGLLPARANPCR